MKKILPIILCITVLFFCAAGCSSADKNEETTATTATTATETTKKLAQTSQTTVKETTTKTTKAADSTTAVSSTAVSTTKPKKTEKKTKTSTTKKTVTKAKKEKSELFCYIRIECTSVLDNFDKLKEGHEDFVPENGVILKKTKCVFGNEETTAFDILEKACADSGIKLTSRDTIYGIYVSGINNLDEFDCGSSSGWVYTVNGKSPSVSCGKYSVSSGDEIVFKYVC